MQQTSYYVMFKPLEMFNLLLCDRQQLVEQSHRAKQKELKVSE